MITFETQEAFELAIENYLRANLSVHVSETSDRYWDSDHKNITVELVLERSVISSDSTTI